MREWTNISVDEVLAEINRGHQHVAFLIGSSVSRGKPSNCLSVAQVKQAVLQSPPLLAFVKDTIEFSEQVAEYIHNPDKCQNKIACGINDVPFEQFLACLYSVSPPAAEGTINAAFGDEKRPPNSNHLALAAVVSHLLQKSMCRCISVLTTNYDVCIEAALPKRIALELKRQPLSIPAFEAKMEGQTCQYVKLHGCVKEPKSLVFTVDQMGRLMADPDWGWATSLRDWLCGNGKGDEWHEDKP